MINIPSNDKPYLTQSNQASRLGDIVESFNLDLRSNITGVRLTRSKVSVSENTISGLDENSSGLYGVSSFNNAIVLFTGKASKYVYRGGNSAYDAFTEVTTGFNAPNGNYGDIIQFNNRLWGTSNDDLHNTTDNDTWSNLSASLSSTSPHLLAVLGNRMYVTNNLDQVDTVNSSNTYSGTGTGTLDLGIDGYIITVLMTGNDRVWVGASPSGNNASAQVSWIYEWDGESENQPIRKYKVDTPFILAGCIKDDVPYIFDIYGRLMVFNGSAFQEVARLPVKQGNSLWGMGSGLNNTRAVHPRGMAVYNDEIVINLANRLENNSTTPRYADFPGGIWAYNNENGLYHKFSSSYILTNSTNETDYGQYRIERAGVVYPYTANNASTSEGGTLLWTCKFFENGTSTNDAGIWALLVDDTLHTTKKAGYFITRELHSSRIQDTWKEIYTKYKKLLNSADKIVVKYRVNKKELNDVPITFTSTTTFTTTTNVSDFVADDEVMITQGTGSGKCTHIQSITESSGTYTVTVTDTITGATSTGIANFSKFQSAGSVDVNDTEQIKKLTISKGGNNHWIDIKVYMEWTGENELDGMTIINSDNIK
jgi:hypothetical protein